MPLSTRLSIGHRVQWQGEIHRITAFVEGGVQLRSEQMSSSFIELDALIGATDFRLLDSETDIQQSLTTFPDNVPEPLLRQARELLSHLLEAKTGYRSGHAATADADEPRTLYEPGLTTLTERVQAKAEELGIGVRTLWGHKQAYERYGLVGLVDQRKVPNSTAFSRVDPRVRKGIDELFKVLEQSSNVSKTQMRRRVERWLKLTYPDEEVVIPSPSTFNRLLDFMASGTGIFGSAKGRRNSSNRPPTPYRKFTAERPGETVLIDTTPLDAFALDSLTFLWTQLQLTVAYDLYTRSILAWRFTPVSVKGVDAALILYGVIKPKVMRQGWPAKVRWPYVGIPEHVVIEAMTGDDASAGLAGVPVVSPETVVVDGGRVYISQVFRDACARLGVNIQLARPYQPTDKSQIESLFGTIRTKFVENLRGYKGPDLYARGADIEAQAFHFIDEIEAYFAEWVVTYWQRRPHQGLVFPQLPHLELSPNDMFEEGLAKTGFVYIVPDQSLYYELLPTEWRTVQHYGIDLFGLRYDADILNDFRSQRSPYGGIHEGKWPVRYDPRDLAQVYFYVPSLQRWYTLSWTNTPHAARPFDDATLGFAKSLVRGRGGSARNRDAVEQELYELLNRLDDEVFANLKERKLAAKRVMQAELARHDRPAQRVQPPTVPDADVILDDSCLIDKAKFSSNDKMPESEQEETKFFELLRTVDDPCEDDELGF